MRSRRWSGLTERRLTLTRLRGHRVHGCGRDQTPTPIKKEPHEAAGDATRTTGEVIDRFNRAFGADAALLQDIIAPAAS